MSPGNRERFCILRRATDILLILGERQFKWLDKILQVPDCTRFLTSHRPMEKASRDAGKHLRGKPFEDRSQLLLCLIECLLSLNQGPALLLKRCLRTYTLITLDYKPRPNPVQLVYSFSPRCCSTCAFTAQRQLLLNRCRKHKHCFLEGGDCYDEPIVRGLATGGVSNIPVACCREQQPKL
jgi:hypothetical protein